MPVYNGARYIREALDSIVAQEFPKLEIIVVDDGSTDETKEIVTSYPFHVIRYQYQDNGGPSVARNTGIRNAMFDYITFLDADDTWPVQKLQKQFQFLCDNPNIDVITGLVNYVFVPGSEHRKDDYKVESPIFFVQLGAMMLRRKVIDTIGNFNEQLRFSEDHDWLLRIRENKIPLHIVNEIALNYRIHPGNMTKHKNAKDLQVLQALKFSLDRRRKTGLDTLEDI